MGYQQEIEFHTVCFPVTSSLAVVLFFDDKLFQRKACVLKNLHHVKTHRNHTAFLPRISHKNRTELAFFQNAKAFCGNKLHLFEKVLDFELG